MTNVNAFLKLGLRPNLCDAVARLGILHPTPLQQALLPSVLRERKDLIIRDVTGSGKSFGITLALLGSDSKRSETIAFQKKVCPSNLIIVPHNDLVVQVASWVRKILPEAEFPTLDNIIQTTFRPGSQTWQIPTFGQHENNSPHILVGTPTRLLDHWKVQELNLSALDTIVLDEVDQMTPPIPRFNAKKQKVREMHPKEIELLVSEIFASHSRANAGLSTNGETINSRPRCIAISATASSQVRSHLKKLGWIHSRRSLFIDPTQATTSPGTLIHQCVALNRGMTSVDNAQTASMMISEKNASFYESRKNSDQSKTFTELPQESSPSIPQFGQDPNVDDFASATVSYCEVNKVENALVIPIADSTTKLVEAFQGFSHVETQLLDQRTNLDSIPTTSKKDTPMPSPNKAKLRLTIFSPTSARGMHFENYGHIFILGSPKTANDYLHLSGRVGRMGHAGTVVTMVPYSKAQHMTALLKYARAHVEKLDSITLVTLRS
jgi:superfamily II DNA/RNA helicase